MKSESLINKSKQLLNNLAFSSKISLTSSFEENNPLIVLNGYDSIDLIGNEICKDVKRQFTVEFPQEITRIVIPDNPSRLSNFKERDIDLIQNQKERVNFS